MSLPQFDPLTGFLLGIAFSALFVAAGAVLGGVFVRRRLRRGRPAALSPQQSERLTQTLLQWASVLQGDVVECQQRMQLIQQGAFDADLAPEQSPELLVDMMTQMIQANGQMRKRLTVAEDALAQQATRIAESLNEARTDALTGLPNRRMFDEELARRHAEFTRYGTSFTLLMFDIDHFKRFNDKHGHLAGDEVLRGIARTIGRTLRESDLLARLGGEEFAAILASTEGRDSAAAAERARTAVADAAIDYQGAPLRVTVSCGLAEPIRGESPVDLVRRSDEALYASKKAGRNCGHWHDGMRSTPLNSQSQSGKGAAAAALPKSDLELAAACDALRARLLEVTTRG